MKSLPQSNVALHYRGLRQLFSTHCCTKHTPKIFLIWRNEDCVSLLIWLLCTTKKITFSNSNNSPQKLAYHNILCLWHISVINNHKRIKSIFLILPRTCDSKRSDTLKRQFQTIGRKMKNRKQQIILTLTLIVR